VIQQFHSLILEDRAKHRITPEKLAD